MQKKKGKFVISLDTELAWGTRGESFYNSQYEKTREIIKKLLKLMDEYEIPATWAIVGHLFLKDESEFPVEHSHKKEIWYPNSFEDKSLWFAPEIVEWIKSAKVNHEIGSHGFTHALCHEERTTREVFISELKGSQSVAKNTGVDISTLVYPQNSIKYTDTLSENGFSCYRGVDPTWYNKYTGILKKLGHVLDNYFRITPPTVNPVMDGNVVNLPGSYFFPHKDGWAKFLPISFRVKKAKKAIKKAIKNGETFHLWFHPFNFASDEEGLLEGLENVFEFVQKQVKKGKLESKTMRSVANEYKSSRQNNKVMIFDAHLPATVSALRSLHKFGERVVLVSHKNSAVSFSSKYAGEKLIVPDPMEDKEGYKNALKNYFSKSKENITCLNFSDASIIPLIEMGLPKNVFVSGNGDSLKLFDKIYQLRLAKENGVNIPKTFVIDSLDKLANFDNANFYPLIVKPKNSVVWANGRGTQETAKKIDNFSELKKVVTERNKEFGDFPLIQECIVGEERGVFCLSNAGNATKWFSHQRLRSLNPSGGASSLRKSIALDPKLKEMSEKLVKAMKWTGPLMIEWKYDQNKSEWKLMEVNARFWGSLPLAIHSGRNYPVGMLKMLRGDYMCANEYKVDVYSRNLLADFLHAYRVQIGSSSLGFKLNTLKDVFLYFGRDKHHDVLSLKDIKPFFAQITIRVKK